MYRLFLVNTGQTIYEEKTNWFFIIDEALDIFLRKLFKGGGGEFKTKIRFKLTTL